MTTSSSNTVGAALVADLQRIFASRLRSVVAYGPGVDGIDEAPLTCLALVDTLTLTDLEGCARHARDWERRHLAAPLVLPVEEFRRSLDAFPLEYGEIIRTHVRLFGDDPFTGIAIDEADLRRACETQIKSHLVHLRESFIEAGNRPERIAEVVTASAAGFSAVLRHVAQLTAAVSASRTDAALAGARAAGLDESIVRDIASLERMGRMAATDASRLFPAYLEAVERLAAFVDSWQ